MYLLIVEVNLDSKCGSMNEKISEKDSESLFGAKLRAFVGVSVELIMFYPTNA